LKIFIFKNNYYSFICNKAYNNIVPKLEFYGPTSFSEVIAKANSIAQEANCRQEKQKYTILLIITDGKINDMDDTKRILIEASKDSPLSVVIFGVGDKDNFEEMEELDGDGTLLKVGPNVAARDIVQFVTERPDLTKDADLTLTERLMAEIPGQLLEFMHQMNIKPNPTHFS
jgi:uncharacterized protein YegL